MKKNLIKTSMPVASAEAVSQFRRQRWNPLRYLTPESLARALEGFENGHLQEFCMISELVGDRDDTINCVKSKREKRVAARPWSILMEDESSEAQRHHAILEKFWGGARAVNAVNKNERGGLGRLIKQMMTAASFRYAAHHLLWQVRDGSLTATFEFVPLVFSRTPRGD